MKSYRCYEAVRNAVGGLDPVGTGWEMIENVSAQAAADERAEMLRDLEECQGNVIVATDDNGDSAEAVI